MFGNIFIPSKKIFLTKAMHLQGLPMLLTSAHLNLESKFFNLLKTIFQMKHFSEF